MDNFDSMKTLIKEYFHIIGSSGWAGKNPSRTLEGVLTILLRRNLSNRPLHKILNEVASIPYFESIKIDLILNTLLFEYDKTLMIESKEILSKEFNSFTKNTDFLKRENIFDENVSNLKLMDTPKATDEYGVSIVLFYEYPADFESKINNLVSPIENKIFKTQQPHFTVLNVCLGRPKEEADEIYNEIQTRFSELIENDLKHLILLDTICQNSKIKNEIRLMKGGSIIFFGSSPEFLKGLYSLRRYLIQNLIPLNSISAQYNIWMHTVFARLRYKLEKEELVKLQEGYKSFSIETFDVKSNIGLMEYNDGKAIIKPVRMEYFNLDKKQWQPYPNQKF